MPLQAVAGIGLRDAHSRQIACQKQAIGWLEIHTENLFGDDPRRHRRMEALRAHYPLSLHGVGLSLGSVAPLDRDHLRQVVDITQRYTPALVSEHACWGAHGGYHSNQLLPLPHTLEAAAVLSDRISEVQDALRRTLAIEPVARYLDFEPAEMSEPEFLAEILRRSGCQLLLDISNLHINSRNQGFDPLDWLTQIPAAAVAEYHLAGFADDRGVLIDTHDRPVATEVWALYEEALARIGPRPTLIEWDAELPALDTLLGEMKTADRLILTARERVPG